MKSNVYSFTKGSSNCSVRFIGKDEMECGVHYLTRSKGLTTGYIVTTDSLAQVKLVVRNLHVDAIIMKYAQEVKEALVA